MASLTRSLTLILGIAGVVGLASAPWVTEPTWTRRSAVLLAVAVALGVRGMASLRTYQYTAWIIAAVVVGLCLPELLLPLNPDDKSRPQNKWIMLVNIQLVMFGISTQMGLADFRGLGHMRWAVFVGVFLQFTVMPLTGFVLAQSLELPKDVAAGVILIGSCSSGLASNVLTYIAGANLPLSIALTAVGMVLAPFITPMWMSVLAGQAVEKLGFVGMMMNIIEVMLAPLGAALLHDFLRTASTRQRRAVGVIAAISVMYLVALAAALGGYFDVGVLEKGAVVFRLLGFLAGGWLAGAGYHLLWRRFPSVAGLMPIMSMFGIVYYTAITTAAGREELLKIGGLLIAAVAVHNAVGYVLGYWVSRAVRLGKQAARTVAIEVGLQNGGMATGIAAAMGKVGTLGLAAAIFSPWMNVSGSILANYWRRRPVEDAKPQAVELHIPE